MDFLLSMQEPKRKVKSFITDLEKREIASSNYLVKKYNINYIESFENDSKDNDVLLISNPDFNFENILNSVDNFQTVILFNCSILLHKFEQTGFKISSNDDKIIVLKK